MPWKEIGFINLAIGVDRLFFWASDASPTGFVVAFSFAVGSICLFQEWWRAPG